MKALYFPLDEDEELLRLNHNQPLGSVVERLEDGRADLLVTDDFGLLHRRTFVPISRMDGCDHCVLV